jgi:hypothetical protein
VLTEILGRFYITDPKTSSISGELCFLVFSSLFSYVVAILPRFLYSFRQAKMWQVCLACSVPGGIYGNWIGMIFLIFQDIGITQVSLVIGNPVVTLHFIHYLKWLSLSGLDRLI